MPPDKNRFEPLTRINRVASAASFAASLAVRLLGGPGLTRFLALVLGVGALLYAGRLAVHLAAGFAGSRSGSEAERTLARMVLIDAVLCVLWIADAAAFWIWPSPAGQLVLSLILWPLVILVACATVDLAAAANKGRGTEFLRSLKRVKRLRELAKRSGPLRPIENHMEPSTPPGDTSSFINRLAMVLLVVVAANVPIVLAEVAHDLQHYGHKPGPTVARAHSSPRVLSCKRRVPS
jgi:hypothetical protein